MRRFRVQFLMLAPIKNVVAYHIINDYNSYLNLESWLSGLRQRSWKPSGAVMSSLGSKPRLSTKFDYWDNPRGSKIGWPVILDSESIGSRIVLDQLGALPFPSSSIKVSWILLCSRRTLSYLNKRGALLKAYNSAHTERCWLEGVLVISTLRRKMI